ATIDNFNLPVKPNTGITDIIIIHMVYIIICKAVPLSFLPVGSILNIPFLYSSSNIHPNAQKCGNCQKNCIINKVPGSIPKLSVAATHPNIKGMAPGKAPTKTAKGVLVFNGV